ncbi:MAG TPA: diguanylate cyclase [Oscillospiraceae bacterium]|nr:diguanylate cyclase [Oscillospiraceae bacterium]HPF56017.1 diguanylate cyclase [Clostridiales bacterium]HPK35494.1 diguanylate cyclase [Oscillospiraceae bacterium]HPR76032.1 diguanylate cyclase [Oscillospiraceae bacterium]
MEIKNNAGAPDNKYIAESEQIPNGSIAKKTSGNDLRIYENFGLFFNASSIGLIITDINGKIIAFNKSVHDIFGFDIKSYKNTNITELYTDSADRKRLLNMLAISTTIRDFEVKIKHKNGTSRAVLANIDAIQWQGEQMLLTSLYDITQYKQVQDESERDYQALFNNVPVGITVTDLPGNLVLFNNSARDLLKYDNETLSDIRAQDFYYSQNDRYKLLNITKKLGSARDFETRFRCADGSVVSVLLNTDIIEFNDQKNMLLTSIRNISNLKHIEDELAKERDFSNAILSIAATLFVVLDRNGKVTRFNHACEKLSGYSFSEVKETYLWDIPFIEPKITREQLNKLLAGGYAGAYETNFISKSNEKHLISWTFAAMPDSEEHIKYIIATGIDITKSRHDEEELHQANSQLASRVYELQERTEEMNLLNEMGEQLQICQNTEEACAISVQYVKRICPSSHGALYLIKDSGNLAEAIQKWGEPSNTQEIFAPLNCWAIRRGRQHLVDDNHPGLLCTHITGPQSGRYVCIPLLANGETIGILHLNDFSKPIQELSAPNETCNDHKFQMVTTIAEHTALALSNLKLKETLRQQSIRDALTGLFNRRYMEESLERELRRAMRNNKTVGVIMIDIDHFKNFNDAFGHDGGDALLRELGVLLKQALRGGDIVCRYGGEEFVMVLPEIALEDAKKRAEEVRQGIKNLSVYHLGKPLDKCTVSLGVAVFPENGNTAETILKAADNALYRAKNEGRDRVVAAETA